MQRAIELAIESVRAGGGPFGAVVVRGGRIVAEGANRVVLDRDPTAHAEVVAIREACQVLGTHALSDCEIYASCEPCPMCLAAIGWARIPRVRYACTSADAAEAGFDDTLFHRELTCPPPERRIERIQMGREEGLRVFQAWDEQGDRVPY